MATSSLNWLLLTLFFLFLNSSLSLTSDHISLTNPLFGNKTIISQGGKFELGFFQLGNNSIYSNHYLGIWYKKVSQFTTVWVANRNTPISDPYSSQLKISSEGNLVLLDETKTEIWSTNLTSPNSNTTIAILLDTGNLVLRDGTKTDPNGTSLLWQSMDHPTETWLPGGKLGRNKKTGEYQKLVSWKNSDDPAQGIYSLEIDPNGSSQFLIFWNESKPFWTSGEWNGQIFTLVPEMTSHYLYSFDFVSNENETYFTYWLEDDDIITRFVMDLSGRIEQLTWVENSQEWILLWTQPQTQCNVYALCGAFGTCDEKSFPYCSCVRGFKEMNYRDWELNDQSGGCKRKTPLQCGDGINSSLTSGKKDQFLSMPTMGLPDNSFYLEVRSVGDCEKECLKNCSCTGYTYSNYNCSVWYGDLLNLHQDGSSGDTLYLRLAASEFKESKNVKNEIIYAVVGSIIFILLCLVIVYLMVRGYRRRRFVLAMSASLGSLVAFRYDDLQRMTRCFSERLGGGSFGSVFKGIMHDSGFVAVKRLEGMLQVGEKQFRSEVSTIGTIQHVNLVRLRGFCSERANRLLVYEYIPNGSLDKQLFQQNVTTLDWNKRYQIALGTARGLAYMHESCRDYIIHCDIKPENILLDESFVPKVADFGMAKLIGRDFSRVLTTMRGTIGYLAPEWISGVAITPKTDVYSYGLVVLEIISGRRNIEKLKQGDIFYFPLLAAREVNEGNTLTLLDPRLKEDLNQEEVERACRIACWCIQDDENNRPSMGHVVQVLEGVLDVSLPPIPRSLQALAENVGSVEFFRDLSVRTELSNNGSLSSISPS
ncbi:hypothetical protein LUZ60_017442 [Juncus effusus]|nr:hypothetical protein LUZ60_017442 [Juncus effusus]